MRIIPERLSAPMIAALPDLSEVPARRQMAAGIVASIILHLCLFALFAMAMHPGQDPAALLAKYPNRWGLMHLKDIRKGAATGSFTGHAPLTDDVTLGTGQVVWPRVLTEAARVGVQYYFIEDESPTVLEQLPNSLKYLASLKAK